MRRDREEMYPCRVYASENESGADMALVSTKDEKLYTKTDYLKTYWKSLCLSMVMAVTTRGLRPVESAWSSIWEEMRAVVNSVSAAVPAPQQRILSVM